MTIVDKIIHVLKDCSATGVLPPHIESMKLTADTTLGELGIDSLGRMTLLTELMDLTDEYLADDAFEDSDTLGTIALKVGGTVKA